jgi:hypothetical protein
LDLFFGTVELNVVLDLNSRSAITRNEFLATLCHSYLPLNNGRNRLTFLKRKLSRSASDLDWSRFFVVAIICSWQLGKIQVLLLV